MKLNNKKVVTYLSISLLVGVGTLLGYKNFFLEIYLNKKIRKCSEKKIEKEYMFADGELWRKILFAKRKLKRIIIR